MRISIAPLFTLAALVQSCVGSPTAPGATNAGRLVITLKDDVSRSSFLAKFNNDNLRRVASEWDSINGFSGVFDEATVSILRNSPEVLSIEEDNYYHATELRTQNNAPWGLSRLSAPERLQQQNTGWTNYSYTYDSSAGRGVDIYLLDTGIRTTHDQFGGRARWGATFGGYQATDSHGHGTHMAGIAAGSQFGVAKAASIIAVRVLNDSGSGTLNDIVSGLNWVYQQHRASGRPSVVALPLAGGASAALDSAVTSLTNNGIHVVVAAGNQNTSISNISPARVPSVISVGSTTIADARVGTSNYGNVTTHAPGQSIISAWNTNNSATNTVSGTSASTAYVAGTVAYFIAYVGNMSPSAMTAKVIEDSLINYISGMPQGTPNRLFTNSYPCTLGSGSVLRICI